ncbi:acetyltransferase (GNAT) domain protein [Leptospira yanagawae serovar Saopaulo str. Sao Paulo = ATCC 700523]|uniref:Acetyltransferase (GNAT) domain protein n=2 Tax=Leptospira yanagawae TaxID=293069 RepID=A0A5E8H8F5_9LEPT|nr:acetyltransferase (GNAT) domain protein [Leptospira yanagawae serovar Saopaulo str. Sao Paulo = ATCC 700523]
MVVQPARQVLKIESNMKIKLRNFSELDIEQIYSWSKNEEFLLIWAGPLYKMDSLKDQLKNDLEYASTHPERFKIFSVIDSDNSDLIGHCQLTIDQSNESAHISRILVGNENFRGKGIGRQIITNLLEITFLKLNLNRVTLNVYDFNVTAIDCYKKTGFKKEGLLRENTKFKGTFWSTIPMAILKSEYQNL